MSECTCETCDLVGCFAEVPPDAHHLYCTGDADDHKSNPEAPTIVGYCCAPLPSPFPPPPSSRFWGAVW